MPPGGAILWFSRPEACSAKPQPCKRVAPTLIRAHPPAKVGILIGLNTLGFVADLGLAGQLAETGIMLLMFGVGLHFSLHDLIAVRRIAVLGAIVQIVVAVLLGMSTALVWGWSLPASLVFGLCLSVASTVVLLRTLEAKGLLQSVNGQIAPGQHVNCAAPVQVAEALM